MEVNKTKEYPGGCRFCTRNLDKIAIGLFVFVRSIMLGHGDNADGYGLGRMQICRGDKVDLFQCIMSKLMNNQRFA